MVTPADFGIMAAKFENTKRRPTTYLRAQVVYKQGLVKDFIVPSAWTLDEFMHQTQLFGKVRLLRSLRAVQDVSIELAGGNVTVLPRKGVQHASR